MYSSNKSQDPKPFMSPRVASLILAGIPVALAAVLTSLVIYALWTGGLPTRSSSEGIVKSEDPVAFWIFISIYQAAAFFALWLSTRLK